MPNKCEIDTLMGGLIAGGILQLAIIIFTNNSDDQVAPELPTANPYLFKPLEEPKREELNANGETKKQERMRVVLESAQSKYDALAPEEKIKHYLDGQHRFESLTGLNTRARRSKYISSLSNDHQSYAREYSDSLQFADPSVIE